MVELGVAVDAVTLSPQPLNSKHTAAHAHIYAHASSHVTEGLKTLGAVAVHPTAAAS
jgi:hypothetical protein